MAFTFDSTIKGPNSTSYVSIDECSDYFGGHPDHQLWEDLSVADQERYATRATTRLDYEDFVGSKTDDTQALQWPRNYVMNRDATGKYYHDSNTIPRELKLATYQLIMFYLEEAAGLYPVTRREQARLSRNKVGPLDVDIRKANETDLPSEVLRALRSIGPEVWTGGKATIKLVR